MGRLHEPVEEVEVAVARERPVQAGQALPALCGQVPQQPLALGGVGRTHGPEVLPEPELEDVDVAHGAEGVGEPGQLGAQRLGPLGVEHHLEGPQVAAEATGAHPGLVDTVGAEVEPDDRVVGQQALHRGGDGLLHERGHGGVRAERFGRGIRGRQRRRAQCPDQLGRGVGCAGPGLPQRVDHRVHEAVGRAGHGLGLELAEAGRHPLAVEHGDLVVAHLRQGSAPAVAQHHDAAIALEAGDGLQRSPSQQARDGAGQLVGDLPGRGVHLDLGAVHRPTAGAGRRHLERPPTALATLAEPVAQRHVRADEAQIGGVVVGRVEVAVIGLGGGDAVVHPAEVGQHEAGPGRQLHLPLGVAAGLFARPALSHPPRPCGCEPGPARRAGAGSRCRRRR